MRMSRVHGTQPFAEMMECAIYLYIINFMSMISEWIVIPFSDAYVLFSVYIFHCCLPVVSYIALYGFLSFQNSLIFSQKEPFLNVK